MPLNHSPLSYADCKGAFERALESAKGVKISCETEGKAVRLVHRLHAFRAMNRVEKAKIYPEDHPMHGLSPYDRTVVRRIGSDVLIEPVNEDSLKMEEIV